MQWAKWAANHVADFKGSNHTIVGAVSLYFTNLFPNAKMLKIVF
jgi:hypothetical protein